MKAKLVIAASILAATTAAHAFPPKPAKCPSVASLAAAGLSRQVISKDPSTDLWVVGIMKHPYDTTNNWTFLVSRIRANDGNDAFNKATGSLSSLFFQEGPVALTQIGKWGCSYGTSWGYTAVAYTPNL